MAGGSQYLQVPKFAPNRRTSSRSSSPTRAPRPREGSPRRIPPIRSRPQSPPIPPVDRHRNPTLNGFKTDSPTKELNAGFNHVHINVTPSIEMEDITMEEPLGTNYDDLEVTNYGDLNGTMYTLEQSATPPPEAPRIPLRQRLIGTWNLESYITYPTPESQVRRVTYPMTRNVTGFIMYTPDGYMSAHMLIPGQQAFKRGEGDDAQWLEAAKRFFAYGGPYYITNEGPGREETLRHTFQVCNLPGWLGDIQIRTHRFEEDGEVLVLGSEEHTEIRGDKRQPVLKWRRARNNSDGVPPPPMPQIKISKPGEP